MNSLKLEILPNPENKSTKIVRIYIDGSDLISMLKEYESYFAKKEGNESIAGQYEGLNPRVLYSNLNSLENNQNSKDLKVDILDCECGVWGCWSFMTSVVEKNDRIIWTDFEQLHRGTESHNFWNYSNFGSFEFEKKTYLAELEKLISSS